MKVISSTASFTRPSDTTAYTIGDLVSNSTTNTSVVPMTFSIPYGRGLKLWKIEIAKSTATITNCKLKLHLYKDSPTVANGDNGAYSGIAAGHLGTIEVDISAGPTFTDSSVGQGAPASVPMFIVADVDCKIYGLLEATAAYTPASAEVFTVSLLGEAYV